MTKILNLFMGPEKLSWERSLLMAVVTAAFGAHWISEDVWLQVVSVFIGGKSLEGAVKAFAHAKGAKKSD